MPLPDYDNLNMVKTPATRSNSVAIDEALGLAHHRVHDAIALIDSMEVLRRDDKTIALLLSVARSKLSRAAHDLADAQRRLSS